MSDLKRQIYGDQQVWVEYKLFCEKYWQICGHFDAINSGLGAGMVCRFAMSFIPVENRYGEMFVDITETCCELDTQLAEAFGLDNSAVKSGKRFLKNKGIIVGNKKGYFAFSPKVIEFISGEKVIPIQKK